MSATPAIYHQKPRATRVVGLGVDYLTATQEHGELGEQLWKRLGDLMDTEAVMGNDVKERTWQGYEIQTCGEVTRGVRADGVLARLSSGAALLNTLNLLHLVRNVSRIDLQVTGKFIPPAPNLAREAFEHIPNTTAYRGRPAGMLLVANAIGGDTLYRGSRRSEIYGRHYDKGVESGEADPGTYWRWEVEYKGAAAKSVAVSLAGEAEPHKWISGVVYNQWRRWGLEPGFPVLR